MALRSSSTNSGSGTTPSVAVPAGVAIDDIVILTVSFDNGSPVISGKFPTGFTMFSEGATTFDGHVAAVGWKRLTAADSGSYTFSAFGFSGDWIAQAFAFSGRHTTNAPAASAVNTVNTGGASPRTISANGLTAVAGDDLVWVSSPDVNATGIGNGHTPPSGYTERQDVENLWTNLSAATLENASAGATGTVSGTFAMTSGQCAYMAWLVAVPAAAGGATPVSGTDSAAETEGTPTLVASSTRTDTATATDTTTAVAVSVSATDSATATDASSLDAGSTAKSASDTLTATDATSSVVAASTVTDSASATDASTVAITQVVGGTDSAAVTDAVDQVVLTDDAAEGTLTEAAALAATFTRTDSASFADSATVTVIGTNPSASDSAALSESASIVVTLTATDSGAAADIISGATSLTSSDGATLTETATVAVTLTTLETAALTEQAGILSALTGGDSWALAEVGAIGSTGLADGVPVRRPTLALSSTPAGTLTLTGPDSTLELS